MQVAEENEVKSASLHHIRSTHYTHGISCRGVAGVREEAKKEKCQHIKEARTLNAKVND